MRKQACCSERSKHLVQTVCRLGRHSFTGVRLCYTKLGLKPEASESSLLAQNKVWCWAGGHVPGWPEVGGDGVFCEWSRSPIVFPLGGFFKFSTAVFLETESYCGSSGKNLVSCCLLHRHLPPSKVTTTVLSLLLLLVSHILSETASLFSSRWYLEAQAVQWFARSWGPVSSFPAPGWSVQPRRLSLSLHFVI